MGGSSSSYAAQDWFTNFGNSFGNMFSGMFEKLTGMFGSFSSILSSPILIIGIGAVGLYFLTSSRGKS